MTDGRVAILYCVSSGHSFEYRYQWDNVLGPVGVTSPVIYAFEPGTYRCTMTNGVDTANPPVLYALSLAHIDAL